MSHGHDHLGCSGEAMDRRLVVSGALNLAITGAELVGGIASGSLALLSDAAHNLGDVMAVALAILARRMSLRPPTPRHTYGLKRVEVVAALLNVLLLIVVTVLVSREAIARLLHPAPVTPEIMLTVALIALGANVGSVLLLRRHDRHDLNVRAAFLHLLQDALASLAVVVAALLARTAVGRYVDSVAALVVGLVVSRSALLLGWETLSTILEGAPRDVDVVELAERVAATFAPARLHHVHVWELGPRHRLFTAHATLGREMDGREIEAVLARIKRFLHDHWAINHATIEPEIAGCSRTELLGRWQVAAVDRSLTLAGEDPPPAVRA
jgi:cobalt-zinc-cadmium efflux system protein